MNSLPEPVAVIGGTGDLGQGICKFLLHHGVETIIGSRKEEKAQRIMNELVTEDTRSLARGLQNNDAAEEAEFVILAIPFWGHDSIVPGLKPHVEGKVVMDTSVPLDEDNPRRYDEPEQGSAGLAVREVLGDVAEVGAGMHTMSAHKLSDPDNPPTADVFYCGSEPAREVIGALIDRLGFTGRDAGPLWRTRTLERLTPMMIHFNIEYGKKSIGLKLVGAD